MRLNLEWKNHVSTLSHIVLIHYPYHAEETFSVTEHILVAENECT